MKNIFAPPTYCQYIGGQCDQKFTNSSDIDIFFLYPSEPKQIANTIESAREKILNYKIRTWKDLNIPGKIIFCEICKEVRRAKAVVTDVTTLNFNLLFEIGFCLGLNIPIIPIRDVTYESDKREFDEMGLLDTIGYVDFTNSDELTEKIKERLIGSYSPLAHGKLVDETYAYVLKGPIDTDGVIQLLSIIKKANLKFKIYDPKETPRLSLFEAKKNVFGSIGVIAYLLTPNRKGYKVHNAICALLCGMALAQEKVVTMLQEDIVPQPIDYRDIVWSYIKPEQISNFMLRPIKTIFDFIQQPKLTTRKIPEKLLEKVDLGDVAAENEIKGLQLYFVRTGQYNQAKQGHTRLIVGRKGSGKTAIFYEILNTIRSNKSTIVIGLKPEGHQFIKLKEAVLSKMTEGVKEHTMIAFWNYILLCELAKNLLEADIYYAERDPERLLKYNKLKDVYRIHDFGIEADFSQRLLMQVDRITRRVEEGQEKIKEGKITELIFGGDIRQLNSVVSEYLSEKDAVWFLIDNIDKAWPTRGAKSEDILIVRSLLDAARKLQQQHEAKKVNFKCLVFIRTDIYEHLIHDMPDKGKDTPINLDWDDIELFKEIVRKRIEVSTDVYGTFDELWRTICITHINAEDSFNYIIERTLMRPRDLVRFLKYSLEVAINRNHSIVNAEDILQAEKTYSEDIFLMTCYEIEDTYPQFKDVLYNFMGANKYLHKNDIESILKKNGVDIQEFDKIIELLLWFSFIGVYTKEREETYSYMVSHNLRHLYYLLEKNDNTFSIHSGFRKALNIAN